jgi:hypothetical protein
MNNSPGIAQNARHAISTILSGGAPNGIQPAECGPWSDAVRGVFDGYAADGTSGARRVWASLVKAQPQLARLVASDLPPEEPIRAAPRGVYPELPASAQTIYQHAAPCAAWLDAYIAFATQAAPMTPRSFHEAAGLFAVAVAVARRVALYVGTTAIYPNLYLLFVAPSTLYHKTTGMQQVLRLLRRAGLSDMLLPHRITPEAMVQELTTDFPGTFNTMSAQSKETWTRTRAIAAQRGWMLDEASRLLKSMRRENYAALLELLLDLYECPDHHDEQTVGRGRTTIKDAYISFFGATTPATAGPFLADRELWASGLWPRFALIEPDEESDWHFHPPAMDVPQLLIDQLVYMYHLFPVPHSDLAERVDSDGNKTREIVIANQTEQAEAVALAPGVWDAWAVYDQAIHGFLRAGAVDDHLFPAYGRLSTRVMKVAMLLAVMDADDQSGIRVELAHLARAQQIVERWRRYYHTVWAVSAATEEEQTTDRILAMLSDAGQAGLDTRSIYQPLHMAADEARSLLGEFALMGHVERFERRGGNGRAVECWRLVPAELGTPKK